MTAPLSLGETVWQKLEALAAITDEPGVITRLYLSPAHRRAVDLVESWMQQAGMATRLDGVATLIGRYEGQTPGAKALLIGSHIDTVRNAGRFDGTLGVIAGIALVARLHKEQKRLPFAIEILAFGDEEGVRFPSTLTGSRAIAGTFDAKLLEETDADAVTRRAALETFGCIPGDVAASRRTPGDALAYIEMHIEQGPLLEARNLAIGIVTAINGTSRGWVDITGLAGHAGTVPMPLRLDALAGASEMVLGVERIAQANPDIWATVGQVLMPGSAINTIPGTLRFSVDVRSSTDATRHKACSDIVSMIKAVATRRGLQATIDLPYDAPAAPCDTGIQARLEQAAAALGIPTMALPSGAGHDAMAFRQTLPMGMLFVRSRAGLSHHPDEFTSKADIEAAMHVFARFLDTYSPV